ncbi:MAG: FAD-dependent oxidoreductase [Planctomycetes bacterium]|nr:FAD-dependent oxidoreductase [Planctomycetota bacterium]
MSETIAVVGAGMAGCAAALRLSERGEQVVLIERRRFLGGRATSFADRVTGDEIDNAQHVLLGCCTNVIDLLGQLGQAEQLRWHDRFHYFDPEGRRHDLARCFLPAPLHYGPSLLGWGALGLGERLGLVRAFLRLMLGSGAELESLRQRTIGDWLRARGQSERSIARFWRPIIVSAVNEEVEVAAALPALQVFVEGFLPHRRAALLGVPRLGLARLFAEPTAALLTGRGARLRTQTYVREILVDRGHLSGLRLATGEAITCRRAVLAIPPEALAGIPVSDGRPLLETMEPAALRHSPIVGLHLWFDREVMDLPHAALLDARLEWAFAHEPGPGGRALGARQRVQGVFSAGRDLIATSPEAIVERSLTELARAFPGLREARLVHATVVKENRATLVLDPATESRRPGARTRIEGLVLAGDWTRSGWPATLEGSCRSGRLAAAVLLDEDPARSLTPDLPRGLIARLLMARLPRRIETPWEPR